MAGHAVEFSAPKNFCRALLCSAFFALSLIGCKKAPEKQSEPIIPAVVLSGGIWTTDENGLFTFVDSLPQGQTVYAYTNVSKKETLSPAEIKRNVTMADETCNFIHVALKDFGKDASQNDFWVKEENLVLNASPALLMDALPFIPAPSEEPHLFSQASITIPADSIVAIHHPGMWLDELEVTCLLPQNDDTKPVLSTGFIPNPHPSFSTNTDDMTAIRLRQQSLNAEEPEKKKMLLDLALSLNLTSKIREKLQAERKSLEPPPKPNVSYERVRIPSTLFGGAKSKYGVNMTELLSGGTEDPWEKKQ